MNVSPNARLRQDHARIIRSRLGLVFFIFLLVLGAAALITLSIPKEYVSFATVQVEPDSALANSGNDATGHPISDPQSAGSQFQKIMSRDLLAPIVQRFGLENKWSRPGTPLSPEAAYNKLLSLLRLETAQHPNLIRISVYGSDPQEPTLLANAIAQAYTEQQNSQRQTIIEKRLEQLKSEVEQRETSVSAAFARASRLRTEAGFLDPNPDSTNFSKRVQESSAPSDQDKLNQVEANIATLRIRIDELDRLKAQDVPKSTDLLSLNDPVLEQKLPLYQNALAERARLLTSGLGHNHPDVRAIQTQIDAIEGQLRQQIDGIRNGLALQLAAAEDAVKRLQQSLEASQTKPENEAEAQCQVAKNRYDDEREQLQAAKAELVTATAEAANLQKTAVIFAPAETALLINRPKIFPNLSLGAIAGLLLGIAFAGLVELLDRRVKNPNQIERLLRVPVLAVVPKSSHLLPLPNPEDLDAEIYQVLKTNVDSTRQKVAASVLSVVSGGPGEGKSTTAGNLATVYAGAGQQTLIVDANLRRPAQHELFGLHNQIGLSDYLRGTLAFAEIVQHTEVPNLFIITSGSVPASAVTLLTSQKFADLVEIVKEWFDVVIIDCPPILGTSDAAMISALAEGSIIVAQHRRYPRSTLVRAKAALQNLGTKVLGVVLNNAYVKPNSEDSSPASAVKERRVKSFGLSDLEAAANRSPRNEAY